MFSRRLLVLTTSLLAIAACAPASAATIADVQGGETTEVGELRKQLTDLKMRLDTLEAEAKKAPKTQTVVEKRVVEVREKKSAEDTSKYVTAGDLPGSIKIPGTDTSLQIGGYAKADLIYDFGQSYGNPFSTWASIPLTTAAGRNANGEFTAHAKQTRLSLTTQTPTEYGALKAYVEADFYGAAGSELATNPNSQALRQAYGQLGPVLVGQSWSTFWDGDALPETLDFAGPVGVTIVRQVQARATSTSGPWTFMGAIENPFSDYTSAAGAPASTAVTELPDLVGGMTYKDAWGHVSLRGVARQVAVQNTATRAISRDGGYGLSLTGSLKATDSDTFLGRAFYGNGAGRYLYDLAVSGNGNVYKATGEVESQRVWGGYLSYQHKWTPEVRSNLMGGLMRIENDSVLSGTALNKDLWATHANVIWQPLPKFSTGLEFMHGQRLLQNGTKGDLNRAMASATYKFN